MMIQRLQRVLLVFCGIFCGIGLSACGKKTTLDLPSVEEKASDISVPFQDEGD